MVGRRAPRTRFQFCEAPAVVEASANPGGPREWGGRWDYTRKGDPRCVVSPRPPQAERRWRFDWSSPLASCKEGTMSRSDWTATPGAFKLSTAVGAARARVQINIVLVQTAGSRRVTKLAGACSRGAGRAWPEPPAPPQTEREDVTCVADLSIAARRQPALDAHASARPVARREEINESEAFPLNRHQAILYSESATSDGRSCVQDRTTSAPTRLYRASSGPDWTMGTQPRYRASHSRCVSRPFPRGAAT